MQRLKQFLNKTWKKNLKRIAKKNSKKIELLHYAKQLSVAAQTPPVRQKPLQVQEYKQCQAQ